MVEIKGYLTNLSKYVGGELVGEWVTFPIDDEELEKVLERIGIDEENEEFFFADWECTFEHDFGEYESIEYINEIAEHLENWDEDLLRAVCENWGINYAIDNDEDDFVLYDDIGNDYDLGYYWVVDSGCYDLKNMGILADYIDYESFGRDIRFETDGGFSSYGWVEYRG
jgi:antirestriction protein